MTRRSSGPARALVPPAGDDWQDDEAEREAVAGQEEDAGDDEAAEDRVGAVGVDLDESDDLVDDDPDLLATGDGITAAVAGDAVDSLLAALDTPVVATVRPGTRRAAGNARRQLEEYWEKRRMARELEDFEDFEV
jgi:hypothetical protein